MFYRLLLLLLCVFSLRAANYADLALARLATEVDSVSDPVETLLLADRIYQLSHETGEHARIEALLMRLYQGAQHSELKAELATMLVQMNRNVGNRDQVAKLVKEQGYVPGWRILGPLAPKVPEPLVDWIKAPGIQGLNRPVRWFETPAYGTSRYEGPGLGHFGYFSANQAVFPNQLAGSIFTTWFQAPAKGPYRLGLGWNHKLHVWVNRTRIFQGQANQLAHPDQGVVWFQVSKGWNRLTLYLESESEDSNLGFYARLTDSAGKVPLFATNREKGVPRAKAKVLENPESDLLELAQAKSPSALASVMMLKEIERHSEFGSPKDLLLKAFSADPSRETTEKLYNLQKENNERWQLLLNYLKSERAQGQERAWALTLLGHIALNQGRFWEARNYADQAMAAEPDYWPGTLLKLNTFTALGLTGEAMRETELLAERYPGVPWIRMDLADLYLSMNQRSKAEAVGDQILEKRKIHPKYTERKIKLLQARGDVEALDRFYAEQLANGPYAVGTLVEYAAFLKNNRRFDRAEEWLKAYLAIIPENPALLQAYGELLLARGDSGAEKVLRMALTVRPQNPELEKLLQLRQSEADSFYRPYMIAERPTNPLREVSNIVVNFDNTVKKVAPNGQFSEFREMEWEILTQQGTQELPGYSFSYAPMRQRAEVIKAEIERGGQTILLTNFGRSRISDPEYRMYYDLVSMQIPFPLLEVGDRIRLQYRIDETESSNIFGDYFGDIQYFADSNPMRLASYTLIFPKDRPLFYHTEKMNPQFKLEIVGENRVYRWSLESLSPFETEPLMPGLAGYLPYLAVSTFSDWAQMARWYAKLIEDQIHLDSDSKQVVAELTRGVSDRREILRRIHEYVITNTRYVALEFGIHGYKPYDINLVRSRQFGDCKDKASLMMAMLREAGIEASIAIVRTVDQGEVHPNPAMLTYFNHAICYVPEFDLFLDGTAEFSGLDELPQMDQGALTLVVDRKGNGVLRKIPISGLDELRYEFRLELQAEGGAKIAGEGFTRGPRAPHLRQYFSIESKLKQNLLDLLSNHFPGLDLSNAEQLSGALNEPIRFRFEGATAKLMQPVEGGWMLPLELLGDSLVQEYAPNAARVFPLEFDVPVIREFKLDIQAPAGYEITELPVDLQRTEAGVTCTLLIERQGPSRCKLLYRLDFKDHRIEAADYQALRRMFQAHDQTLDQAIHFKKI